MSTNFRDLQLRLHHRLQEQHAIITVNEETGRVDVTPSSTDCRILVIGVPIQGQTTLCHNDR